MSNDLGDFGDHSTGNEEDDFEDAPIPGSDHDREIKPGTPVRDQVSGSWLLVLRKQADTVREYDSRQPDTQDSLLSYEGSAIAEATWDDAVFQCAYLNANNTLAGGRSGPYDFPESRITRYAYDAIDGYDGGRVQEIIREQVLEELLTAAVHELPESSGKAIHDAIREVYGEATADKARELAEFGE